jgi:transposase
MLQITPQHRLMIAVDAVDFRKGLDSLIAFIRRAFNTNPFDGYLFAFRNRKGTSIKLLIYDGNGFWLCQKRFSSGKLAWWPKTPTEAKALRAVELLIILQQGQPEQAQVPLHWRPLPQQEKDGHSML